MFVIRKAVPEPAEKKPRFYKKGKKGCDIWCSEAVGATKFPTQKVALDELAIIKKYGTDYLIMSLEEAMAEE